MPVLLDTTILVGESEISLQKAQELLYSVHDQQNY